MLFAGTGLVLAVDALLLLEAVGALAGGPEAWAALLESSRSATGLGAGLFLLLGTLFFSVRWLRVGVKVPTVRIGVIPEPPAPLVYFAHFGALALCTALVLLVLGGVIL
jgi:fumarate reductase subunit C